MKLLSRDAADSCLTQWIRPRRYFDPKTEPAHKSSASRGAAFILVAVAGVAWCMAKAVGPEWDSAIIVFHAGALIALLGATLLWLPVMWRKVLVSLLLIFHFGGILTAVAAVPSPGGPAPWLANQLWYRLYRPYLQFMYLNNAYHFYSPEPGPATLLWCRIQYSDGTARWAEYPGRRSRAVDPLAQEYYRRVAMNESINQLKPDLTVPAAVAELRIVGGAELGIPSPAEIATKLPAAAQYRVPVDNAVHLMQSYARHVAHNCAHPDPSVEVTGVRMYRVVHAILPPASFARGAEPDDPTLYFPYYHGLFDKEGNLLDPGDPFLYWLVPILATEVGSERTIIDYVTIHAEKKLWR
jgi:hypothetical protein